MSDQPKATRAQNLFLKAFRQDPAGPPSQEWPAPAVLRRWLKNDNFRQTLADIRDALRFQADFPLASAAASSARTLQAAVAPIAIAATSAVAATSAAATPTNSTATAPDLERQLKSLTGLLRLAHLRQRFATDAQPATTAQASSAAAADTQWDENIEGYNPDPNAKNDPRTGLPPFKWNPDWTDKPRTIANIFCDPDKSRLKAYMCLLTSRGVKGFEPFLAGFPEDLARVQQNIKEKEARKAHPPTSPNP